MKKIISLSAVLLLIAMVLFTACESSLANEEEDEGFIIQLSLPPSLTVHSTRSVELSGVKINDAWVVQFRKDGTKIIASHFAETAMSYIKEQFTINVTTSGFTNIDSRFRVIVNAGESFLTNFSNDENTTEADLLAMTNAMTTLNTENGILISDAIDFKAKEGTAGGKIQAIIVAPLNRTYAKVDVTWTNLVASPASIEIKSMKAYNIPLASALYARAGQSAGVYPGADASLFRTDPYLIAEPTAPATSVDNSNHTFYMPENLRGRGCGKTIQEKNTPAYGPTADGTPPALGTDGKPVAGGNLTYCTYIDLVGEYKYNASASPITVRYRVYLGDNLIENYNVQRGYYYNLDVRISGANSGDVRVTITNGNVVVFDEVETINKEVDFR